MNGSLSSIIVRVLLLCALFAISSGYYLAVQSPTYNDGWHAAKKSQLRSLAGSRNCFFSPINCMITHDVSKYRKLAGSV
ncbi:hypothetical protein KIN20_023693 [Parelaphostrongylus tenuis]|uniref:Uncharacterized protein n=1 Tax=Parelaphostrongylus tenuis TaxID=148309 RepID=A0AAD5QXG3_PARTN|nr:hypothetical protein KIN20_023693 [Parelaphostrongylus tenuis]